MGNGAGGRNRTADTRIFSPLLYRLSYPGLLFLADIRLDASEVSEIITKTLPCQSDSQEPHLTEIVDFFDIIPKTTFVRAHLSQTASTMLVLTRKIGESLAINDNIRITVLEVKGKTVRLGIEAPGDVKVYRQEVLVKILEENKQAAAIGKFDPSQVSRWAKDQLQP